MRLRTVAASAVLVLGAGVTATACASSDGGPASEGRTGHTAVRPVDADPCAAADPGPACSFEAPADWTIEEAKPRSGPPDGFPRDASPEGSPTPAPDPGYAQIDIGEGTAASPPVLP
ncbi:hypothetical protein ACQYWQ_06545 [Streptomyces sp. P6-2-1]|uniref:hypothetical protein n=1 Tax=unclassified Streptomyces TaxID=2593676 RepID=UPI003D36D8C1